MTGNWQVVEQLVDADGRVLRRQLVASAFPEAEARQLAAEVKRTAAPEEGQRIEYLAEEAA